MTMTLRQNGAVISFGVIGETVFEIRVERGKVDRAKVEEAQAGLLAAYPGEAETVGRYAARLLEMAA